MVEKRSRIARKPTTPPPAADAWITGGGVDPEIKRREETAPAAPEPEPPPEDKGKPFPHRLSFDMASQQYRRLKRASFESDRTMNDILREAVEEWLKARDY